MSPEAAEWLDQNCWRCGSEDILSSADGRLLCGPCRREALAPEQANGPATIVRLTWESHVLDRCWRCMERTVDPEDDLGLCVGCRKRLRR